MSPEDTRLECLRIADGDVDAAQKMFDFVYPKTDGAPVDRHQLQQGGVLSPDERSRATLLSQEPNPYYAGVQSRNTSAFANQATRQQSQCSNAQLAAVLGAEADDRGLAERVRGGGLWFWNGKAFTRV